MKPQRKQHFYLGLAQLFYSNDGQPKQRLQNFILALDQKKITNTALENAQIAQTQRLCEECGVAPEMVDNLVLHSFTYLGLMEPQEFHASMNSPAETPRLS